MMDKLIFKQDLDAADLMPISPAAFALSKLQRENELGALSRSAFNLSSNLIKFGNVLEIAAGVSQLASALQFPYGWNRDR